MTRKAMSKRQLLPALVLLPALFSVSCILRGPGELRRELSSAAGVELDREIGLTLGRTSTWLARRILKWSGESEVSLRGLHKIQVGVYEVRGVRPGHAERTPLTLNDLPDWTPIVQLHEDDADVFVLTQENGIHIRKMLLVVADDDEWVIVKLGGKLDLIIEDALRLALDEADRPELYEDTRRERGLDPVEDSDLESPDGNSADETGSATVVAGLDERRPASGK